MGVDQSFRVMQRAENKNASNRCSPVRMTSKLLLPSGRAYDVFSSLTSNRPPAGEFCVGAVNLTQHKADIKAQDTKSVGLRAQWLRSYK